MPTTFRDGHCEFTKPDGPSPRARPALFNGRVDEHPVNVQPGVNKVAALQIVNTSDQPARFALFFARAARDIAPLGPQWSRKLKGRETVCIMTPPDWSRGCSAGLFAVAAGGPIALTAYEVALEVGQH